MTSFGFATPRGLGARFEINARFARTDPGFVAADDGATQLPTAHFIAARPAEGWIAALALVTVQSGAGARAGAARRPHRPGAGVVRAVVAGGGRDARAAGGGRARRPPRRARPLPTHRARARRRRARCRPHPAVAREHWTVLVGERRWVLAMELMVQPPERRDHEREALELPFRTLELI